MEVAQVQEAEGSDLNLAPVEVGQMPEEVGQMQIGGESLSVRTSPQSAAIGVTRRTCSATPQVSTPPSESNLLLLEVPVWQSTERTLHKPGTHSTLTHFKLF